MVRFDLMLMVLLPLVTVSSCVIPAYDLARNPYTEWYFPSKQNGYQHPIQYVNVGQRVIRYSGIDVFLDTIESDSKQFLDNGYVFMGKSIVNSSKLSLDEERVLIKSHAKSIGAVYAMCYRHHSHTSRGYRHITVPSPQQTIKIDTRGHVFDGDFSFFKADTIVTLPRTYNTYSIPYHIEHYQSIVMYWSEGYRKSKFGRNLSQ